MFVNHLRNCIAKQYNVLIKRFNLALELDTVNQINRNRNVLTAKRVKKRILQKKAFVIAHDMFRVQRVEKLKQYHSQKPGNVRLGRHLIFVGVLGRFHLNPHGCTSQLKLFAKAPFKVALVRLADMLK